MVCASAHYYRANCQLQGVGLAGRRAHRAQEDVGTCAEHISTACRLQPPLAHFCQAAMTVTFTANSGGFNCPACSTECQTLQGMLAHIRRQHTDHAPKHKLNSSHAPEHTNAMPPCDVASSCRGPRRLVQLARGEISLANSGEISLASSEEISSAS